MPLARSPLPPVTKDELTTEQKMVLQKRQLETDVRNLLLWLDNIEKQSSEWLSKLPNDLPKLINKCSQYAVSKWSNKKGGTASE